MIPTFRSKIKDLIKRGIDTVYIYPFGNRGMEVYSFIQTHFENLKVVRVDNELCKYNKNIISYDKLVKIIQKESSYKKIVLLSSDNPIIYHELRLRLAKDINMDKVVDLFEWSPLSNSKDNRISALSMVGKQIYENKIEGAVAEAGVYKGEFAKYINIVFPDKLLYLFDTFEGFVQEQVYDDKDSLCQTNTWINALKDNAVEEVLEKMPYKENVKIYKGIFPDTAYTIQEKFAFVNLDMDLYYPIYEGLKIFWEHLLPGGVIFVHDFGNWDGVTNAVKEFCKENGIGYIWLNDKVTAVLTKPLNRC